MLNAEVTASARPVGLQAVIVCAPNAANPLRYVGGITLLERLYRQLNELDEIASIVVLKPRELSLPNPSRWVRKTVNTVDASGADGWEMLRRARARLNERFIAIAADLLIDQRLLQWLASQDGNAMLSARPGIPPELAASLSREALGESDLANPSIAVTAASSMPTWWESMHGDVQMHLLRVTNEADAEAGWQCLLDHIQRRTQELPSQYFDIPFENRLVRLLAPTSISANQVTLVTTVLGFAVAVLYLTGRLRVGVLLAILVEVLDGVDGKLARITRTTSKLGEQEHVLDFFYENSWYLALGVFLFRSGHPPAWTVALAMVAFDLTDNVLYALLDVKWGRSLDNVNGFLQRFRRIAGRRNIHTWMFAPGFMLGAAWVSFYLAAFWAGVTAITHAVFCAGEVAHLMRDSRDFPTRAG